MGALGAHAQAKSLDIDGLFKEAGGKKLGEEAFVTYVQGLGAATGHDEVNFTSDRCKAIFKLLAKGGKFGKDQLAGIFEQSCTVKKEISVTEGFSTGESKVLRKVATGTKIQTFG